jgi:6-pyruvoyltetrahydropterin/6-carboxytetrahydropterin synthase
MINEVAPFTEVNPSAENLAKYFYEETGSRLKQATNGRVRVKQVTMVETDVTNATYYE